MGRGCAHWHIVVRTHLRANPHATSQQLPALCCVLLPGLGLQQPKKHRVMQAHAFQEGLKLNPADKVLRQGFWDAVVGVGERVHVVCVHVAHIVCVHSYMPSATPCELASCLNRLKPI